MAPFKQDFLTRQVRHLTQILQQIVFKKNQQKKQEALDEVQEALNELVKDSETSFHKLSLQQTLEAFIQNQSFQPDLAFATADLLIEEGKLLETASESRIQQCFQKALLLYKMAAKEEKAAVPFDFQQKITNLEKHLSTERVAEVSRILKEHR